MYFTEEWFRRVPRPEVQALHGQKVWVCDWRFRSIEDKPIRVVVPTLVSLEVKSMNLQGYTNIQGTISYHTPYIQLVQKNGKYLSVRDSTTDWNRWLHIFDDEQECRQFFKAQMEQNIQDMNAWELHAIERAAGFRTKMNALIKEHAP